MRKDPTEFRARFKAYKEGKMPYENGLPKYEDGKKSIYARPPVYNYFIPFIKDKAITLSNAGLATGAKLSTNLLDSIADNSIRAGLDVDTGVGLAIKESTLGNPTDDRSMRTLLNPQKRRELSDRGYGQHINDYGDVVGEQGLINYHIGDVTHQYMFGDDGTNKDNLLSVLYEGLKFYAEHPDKYNPGQKNYQKLVQKRAKEVSNSPEYRKWKKQYSEQKEKKYIYQPDRYKTTIDWSTLDDKQYQFPLLVGR